METVESFTIDRARASDRDALLDLLYRAFQAKNGQHPRFECLYPEMFDATDESMGRHFVIRQQGVPVSCVGLYPVDLQIGPAQVKSMGLGQVATDPACQGRGMMHALMMRVREELNQSRTALAWLGGRHDRYFKYGWEWAGAQWRVVLDAKSVGSVPPGWIVHEWGAEESVFQALWDCRERQAFRGLCLREEWRRRIGRAGSKAFWTDNQGRFAFVIFNAGWRSVQEWGGDPDGLLALLARVSESGAVTVPALPEVEPAMNLLRAHGASAGVALGMLSVTNLAVLAENYGPVIRERLPPGLSLQLSIREAGRVVTSALLGSPAQGPPLGVELSRPRMTAFLFGPERASQVAGLTGADCWVDQVFPLPFMVAPLFGV